MLYLLSIHFVILSVLWKQHVLEWTIWTDDYYVSKLSENENAERNPFLPATKKNPPNQAQSVMYT